MFKNKGFTLIELLAVIVILAAIALIVTPIILGIISDSKKEAFKATAYGLIDGAKYSAVSNGVDNITSKEFVIENREFTDEVINVTGSLPESGTISVNEAMQVSLKVIDDKWCAYKNYGDSEVTVTDDLSLCASSTNATCFGFEEGYIYSYYDYENYDEGTTECPRDVKIPSSINGIAVTSIDSSTFKDCTLTSVTIPNSVTSIGDYAFENNLLTSIDIPSSVTSIGNGAFNNNQLPNDQAYIYKRNEDGSVDNTFIVSYGGATRNNVVIPNQVTEIGMSSFSILGIDSVTFPNNLLTIGVSAFGGNNLTTITLPDSLTTLGGYAFAGNSINSVTYNSSNLTNIGLCVFNNNPWVGANQPPFMCLV